VSTKKPKVVVIVGQTATGKSDLGVRLARDFNGEIISADSRQVYKGLNIGTGKITTKAMRGIPHHLLNVANPKKQFTVAQYKKLAEKKIEEILKRGKIPIVVGGTGFYIDALLGDMSIPTVPPNYTLRKKLEKKSTEQLFEQLKKVDPARAKAIEQKNKRRLIRAIEIATSLGNVPKEKKRGQQYDVLKIGIAMSDEKLKEKIKTRLLMRIRYGMIAEAKKLHKKGLPWRRMEELGLEYRFLARYLQEKITKEEMLKQLNTAIWQYARRQKTWFKRDKTIQWFSQKDFQKIARTTKKFLKK